MKQDEYFQKRRTIAPENTGGAIGGSTLLSLSLFIILLAFFIILNGISSYSEPKINAAFDSLDVAFAESIRPSDMTKNTDDNRMEDEGGAGDSLEDMQGILRSILPGLDTDVTDTPNDGKIMTLRIKKDQFDKLSNRLIPLFIRILNVKDGHQDYGLFATTNVADLYGNRTPYAYESLQNYAKKFTAQGLSESRIVLNIQKGNPAYLNFQFMGVK